MSGFADQAYAQGPIEFGTAWAERLRGKSQSDFLRTLDDVLKQKQELLLSDGYPEPAVIAICKTAWQAAQEEWLRPGS